MLYVFTEGLPSNDERWHLKWTAGLPRLCCLAKFKKKKKKKKKAALHFCYKHLCFQKEFILETGIFLRTDSSTDALNVTFDL